MMASMIAAATVAIAAPPQTFPLVEYNAPDAARLAYSFTCRGEAWTFELADSNRRPPTVTRVVHNGANLPLPRVAVMSAALARYDILEGIDGLCLGLTPQDRKILVIVRGRTNSGPADPTAFEIDGDTIRDGSSYRIQLFPPFKPR